MILLDFNSWLNMIAFQFLIELQNDKSSIQVIVTLRPSTVPALAHVDHNQLI